MSHNGSTPWIHVAELWGGSSKSSTTLKVNRNACARCWGSEGFHCRFRLASPMVPPPVPAVALMFTPTGQSQKEGAVTKKRLVPKTAKQVNGFTSCLGQNWETGRTVGMRGSWAATVATHLAPYRLSHHGSASPVTPGGQRTLSDSHSPQISHVLPVRTEAQRGQNRSCWDL